MSVIVQPARYSGVSLVEIVDATATGVSLNIRKRDSESILTVFMSWGELTRIVDEAQLRARKRLT